jgi:hypothetical protein
MKKNTENEITIKTYKAEQGTHYIELLSMRLLI